MSRVEKIRLEAESSIYEDYDHHRIYIWYDCNDSRSELAIDYDDTTGCEFSIVYRAEPPVGYYDMIKEHAKEIDDYLAGSNAESFYYGQFNPKKLIMLSRLLWKAGEKRD